MPDYYFNKQDFDNIFTPGGRFFNENMIMFNCTDEIFDIFHKTHSVSTKPSCFITIDGELDESFTKACQRLELDSSAHTVAADMLVACLVSQDIIMKTPIDNSDILHLDHSLLDVDLLDLLNNGSLDDFCKLYASLPMSVEMYKYFRSAKIGDLSILCPDGISNRDLQMSVNQYLTQHSPFNVKLFTKDSRLSSMFTHNGLLMQAVHDFDYLDAKSYIDNRNIQDDEDGVIGL